jgi:hypothetical protein
VATISAKAIVFLVLWTTMAGSFAWLASNRLSAARRAGKFEYLWHGIGQDNWPLLFGFLKALLTFGIGLSCLMTLIGCVWLTWTLLEKLK